MKMHDLNSDRSDVILLIHPMLATARVMEEVLANRLGPDYRYLIPDLSGHGDDSSAAYISAAEEAAAINRWLKEHSIHSIRLAYGASMGGAVLLQLMNLPGVEYEHCFFEGTSFYQKASFICKTLQAMFVRKHHKAMDDPGLAVKAMAELYGTAVAKPMATQFIAMTDENIRTIAHDLTHVQLPMLSTEQQRCCVFAYGARDGMLSEARKRLPALYPSAAMKVWSKCDHCQKLSSDPDHYADVLKSYL